MRLNRGFRYGMLLVLLILILATVAAAKPVATADQLYDKEGSFRGAPYKIAVPADWNGTLLVYAHGYRDRADHPGEFDDRSVQLSPVDPAFEEELLSQGYALAASAYRENGWAVREGMWDTRFLVHLFRHWYGEPDQTILIGSSMGSVIAFREIERHGRPYDGAIAVCPLGAGMSLSADSMITLSLAYDAAFGWPESWGSVGDVRDDLDFESEVLPDVIGNLQSTGGQGLFEFIRLMAEAPTEGFWYPDDMMPFTLFFFTTEVRAELERRARGAPYQNLDHAYTLTDAEKDYLFDTFGVDADPLLEYMNANRDISAEPQARRYTRLFADYSGRIKKPVLTMSSTGDGLHIPSQMSVYEQTVESAGYEHNHLGVWFNDIGGCNVTAEQLHVGIDEMNEWLETGIRPNKEVFPESLGFDHDFEPESWPQPTS